MYGGELAEFTDFISLGNSSSIPARMNISPYKNNLSLWLLKPLATDPKETEKILTSVFTILCNLIVSGQGACDHLLTNSM